MKKLLFLLVVFVSAVNLQAQNVLDDLRKKEAGQGQVVINQSADIESLIVEKAAPEVSAPTESASAGTNASAEVARTQRRVVTDTGTGAVVGSTNYKIMRNSKKAKGYRIQVYTGTSQDKRSDELKCKQIAKRLKASFPTLPVYVHFYSPNWKCRLGNFTDKKEAERVLGQVRSMGFPQACLITGTISIQY